MSSKPDKHEWYSHRQFVESLLPDHYQVGETRTGIIRCISRVGIENDTEWQEFFNKVKAHFGTAFREVNHITCTNHVNFTVYYSFMPKNVTNE